MQKLPIGIQSFEKIRTENYLYVDKTEHIYSLLDSAGYYFFSRPRRFGKSLLISTLKEIFLGKKELFKGLFIEDKIEWNKYPVLHFNWTEIDYKTLGLEKTIEENLFYQASLYEIKLESKTIHSQLQELVRKLHKKYNQQVVLLIDEYDKPIIDFLSDEQIHIAEENREIMKNFYSPIKSLDNELRFFFLTGVSRFTKVSVFSDLNHLKDITLTRLGYSLVGYTEPEVHTYFDNYITKIAKEKEITEEELKQEIRSWYNGYSFGGERLYNPFSVLNFIDDREFNNYWFATGTPTFLVKLMQKGNYYDMDNQIMDLQTLGSFDIAEMQPITILFQTGYLTLIEKLDMNVYRLGYPNKEVKNSMLNMLLSTYTYQQKGYSVPLVFELKQAFLHQDFEKLFIHFTTLFAKIPLTPLTKL
ncbi:AAA family ATPase [Bernardetia sp. ABR2-2B]|uniref:ATP-binding protein n=1 Tax=Bernardetia sp. ABR2-2B TaxID=3127472 RepID=UPI0030D45DA2